MKMKYGEVTDKIIEFLDNVPHTFLIKDALVLTNGKWDIHLDYKGENPVDGIEDLKIFANHKKDLISKLILSEKVPEILSTAHELAEYFLHRDFTVSIGARNSILLGIWLRLRILTAQFFM